MVGERKRSGTVDVTGEWREMGDVSLEAVDGDMAVGVEVGLCDFDARDEYVSGVGGGGDGEAAVRGERLNFGAKREAAEVGEGEEAW